LKVTYTEEAVADIVEAITYPNERNPTAAANLDADIAQCIERLADREFDGAKGIQDSYAEDPASIRQKLLRKIAKQGQMRAPARTTPSSS
jgi:plasmid stabilization system protein ParE